MGPGLTGLPIDRLFELSDGLEKDSLGCWIIGILPLDLLGEGQQAATTMEMLGIVVALSHRKFDEACVTMDTVLGSFAVEGGLCQIIFEMLHGFRNLTKAQMQFREVSPHSEMLREGLDISAETCQSDVILAGVELLCDLPQQRRSIDRGGGTRATHGASRGRCHLPTRPAGPGCGIRGGGSERHGRRSVGGD
jgi:hypothetical protein